MTRSEKKRKQDNDATKAHRRDALSLGSQLEPDKSKKPFPNTSKNAHESHNKDEGDVDVKKRKRPPQDDDSKSDHDHESMATSEHRSKQPKKDLAKQPKIRVSSRGSSIYPSDDENSISKEHEGTASDVKSDSSSVIPGGDFWRGHGFKCLKGYLQRQSIPITRAMTLSGLKLNGQDMDQTHKNSENVVEWIKLEEKGSGSMELYIPRAAKNKTCTIFAVQTVSGDDMKKREKNILGKAARSHNRENSLTLVLYYRKGESIPYELSAGILASTGTVYMIDGPESELADRVVGILATQESPSWVVSERSE